jgi:hypothetical protein
VDGWVLDTSAIEWFAAGRDYAHAVVFESLRHITTLLVPETVLVMAYARVPEGAHHAIDVLLDLPIIELDGIDKGKAKSIGYLLAAPPLEQEETRSPARMAAAHTVVAARSRDWAVVSDGTAHLHAFEGTKVDIKLLRDEF